MTMVIIADDLTGALDTGVKLSSKGAQVKIIPYMEQLDAVDTDVLVIDAETRHLPSQMVYERIATICKRFSRVPYFYIKTDSALRGQIGITVKAAKETLGVRQVAFAPAYPAMHRITRNGRQLIDGKSLRESTFAQDLLNPVTSDRVDELFDHTDLTVCNAKASQSLSHLAQDAVVIYDAETDNELREIANRLRMDEKLRLTVGCAGFAEALSEVIDFHAEAKKKTLCFQHLLVFCGSLNQTTQQQLEFGKTCGFEPLTCSMKTLHDDGWFTRMHELLLRGANVMITITDDGIPNMSKVEQSHLIQRYGGQMLLRLLNTARLDDYAVMVIGGDTLMGFMNEAGFPEIDICGELVPGVVCFTMQLHGHRYKLFSKSGGFGEKTLFLDVMKEGTRI